MQIREALQQAKQILKAAAIDTASLDANLLLSHVTSLSKVMLIAHDEDELSKEQEDKFFSLINKRKSGYPIAYILGYKEFFGLRLKVTEDTLIPRPDTETLVEKALAFNPQGKVLDLGTGTGAIILALKSELKASIDAYAVDLSKKALEVASFNSQKLNLPVTFIQSNWFSKLGDLKFSMIVSCCTMWLCRVSLCIYLCRVWGFGPIAVWIGMACDWMLRSIIFTARFHSRKWLNHHVID